MKRSALTVMSIVTCVTLLASAAVSAQDGRGPGPGQRPTTNEKPTPFLMPDTTAAVPMPQGFTYQGQLQSGSAPYTGTCNMQFQLYSADLGGSPIATYTAPSPVTVTDGLFTTYVDFGTLRFTGDQRYMEAQVSCPYAASPTYTTLSPRTALVAAPYASGLVPRSAMICNSAGSDVFAVTSTVSGDAINAYNYGTGRAGYFRIFNDASSASTVDVATTGNGVGVYSSSAGGRGVVGASTGSYGVEGSSVNAYAGVFGHGGHTGVFGQTAASGNAGVHGENTGSGYGVYANSSTGPGLAAFSNGVGVGAPAVFAENTHTGAEPNGVAIYAKNHSGDAAIVARNLSTGDAIRTLNAAGTSVVFAVRNNGRVWTSAVQIYGGGDLAERFDVSASSGPLEAGTLVVIDEDNPGKLKTSATAYDTRVAGIVSGAGGVNPGLTLHQQGVLEGDTEVAIAGRVYVKADARWSPIRPGDLLTTSDLPGHAMRATDRQLTPGAVIGKAMTALDRGTGQVLVLVSLQ
ncbi:MAG TPA: hypothetical protein PLS53_00905 [Thermoanaerobaculaceae bacterium]|nr:hypothetical protein [Thermoanaerobaculaceae bacterium]HPS76693.1 hypothetical protein [Thermoanaerobaculaceae bacterium]